MSLINTTVNTEEILEKRIPHERRPIKRGCNLFKNFIVVFEYTSKLKFINVLTKNVKIPELIAVKSWL